MSRYSLRLGAVALAAAVGVTGLATGAQATATFELARVFGADRYATAAAVAGSAFPGTANDVIIARGDTNDPADALAGAYLAGVKSAPVLLTQPTAVPQSIKDRLAALGAKNVTILGGTGAVSQAVQDDLGKTYTVTRIQGDDRYDTASKVAQQANAAGVGTVSGKKTAIIASGTSIADALAAGPASYAAKFPIILTTAGSLPTFSTTALNALGIKHALVLGGTNVVNSSVVTQLTQLGITSERLFGGDRYETSTKIADWELANLTGWSNSQLDVANGDNPADSLAGGPAAGRALRPIVLVKQASLPATVATWVQSRLATLLGGRVFGGTSAVSDATVLAVETAAGGGNAPRTGQITAVDGANDRYTLVPTGTTEPITATYKSSDTFAIDGQSATLAAFEAALTAADTITYTPTNGTSPVSHVLTNVNAATINSGTVGNVASSQTTRTFDIVEPVTGATLRNDVDFSSGTYSIDGVGNKTVVDFGNAINEGDTVTITGTAFALTNAPVTGSVDTVTAGNALSPTTFQIGALGDEPASADGPIPAGNDTVFRAGGVGSTDVFTGEATTAAQFAEQLSEGDRVTYTRGADGIETYNLVNLAPPVHSGQATGTVTNAPTGGGSFTLAKSSETISVSYQGGTSTTFIVNGQVSDEAGFEAAYSAGDLVKYNRADTLVVTAERLELTDQPVAGQVNKNGINTGATPSASGQAPDSYQVLATNGFTVLTTVTYATNTAADNIYVLNGATTDLAGFEAALGQIASGAKAGSVTVTRAGTVQTHALSTTA
jgi:hypothetical protein